MDTIKLTGKKTAMIAHRGLSGLERENTNAAFIAAANRSYFGIETDIHRTLDGQYVILHDESTHRVSGGATDIRVEECPYAAVKDVVLPDLDGSTHRQDLRIPLLQDYIGICKKYGKTCVLELKNKMEPTHIQQVVEIIREMDHLEHVIFISFALENCICLRQLLPEQPIQWLIGEAVTAEHRSLLVQHHFALDVAYPFVTKELVEDLHAHGVAVNCWTCNDKAHAEQLIEMGVDFITTNILE